MVYCCLLGSVFRIWLNIGLHGSVYVSFTCNFCELRLCM
jgi:hypothetical protein